MLNDEQKQLLADTIKCGFWGSCEYEFADHDATGYVTDMCSVFITNDAKKGGHYNGRKISAMFRAIYKKVETMPNAGTIIANCRDWWGNKSGDVLFIRAPYDTYFKVWAFAYNA